MGQLGKFLLALGNMVRTGGIKKIEDAFKIAKQEFGEVTPLLKKQIERIFARGKKQDPGAKKEGEIVPLETKQASGLGLDSLKNPFRPGGSLDQVTGITRGLARKILTKRGIEIGKNDPIEVFIDTFGESITDVKNLAEEMVEAEEMGRKLKSADELLEIEGLFDIRIPKNPNKGLTDEEMLKKMEEVEAEDILKNFDPKDREPNAMGGINRTGYAAGTGIKLVGFLARKGKDLKEEIRKAINRFIQPSGDNKLDADVILDDMFEELNVDRDMFDQKDVIDAYGQIYDNLTAKTATTEFLRPSKKIDLPEGVDPKDTILPSGDIVSRQLKVMRLAENMGPGVFEKLNDKQLDIIVKYGDMIDDRLLKQIVLDPDPNNQALAIASIEEAKMMIDKGMDVDEILRLQAESLKRKKNAQGGLNYLMGF